MNSPARECSVLLCGYYGEHNLGDDALLEVLLSELPPRCRPLVTAHDGPSVKAKHGSVRTVPRRSLLATVRSVLGVDALVLGGGSLLQDSTSFKSLIYYLSLITVARLSGKHVILWGQGLGPLKTRLSRALVRAVLPGVQAIGWRDPASQALAARWGLQVPSLMAADPVWSYPGMGWQGGHCSTEDRTGLVLCWRPTDHLDDQGWCQLLQVVDALANANNLPVTWIAFHQHQDQQLPEDLLAMHAIPVELRRRSRFVPAVSLSQVMGVFARSQLVLPMRLHALILAQLAGAPCAALSYDPKVEAAASMAGVDCIDLQRLPSAAELHARWSAQLMQPADAACLERIRLDAARHGDLLREQLQIVQNQTRH